VSEAWINIKNEGYPDFRIFGFHTGLQVEVRRDDGREMVVRYDGYGRFFEKTFNDGFEDVTDWRPIKPERYGEA
jgi:YD repeat-containing protein